MTSRLVKRLAPRLSLSLLLQPLEPLASQFFLLYFWKLTRALMPANRSITVKESKKPKVLFSLRVNLNESTVAEAAGLALAGLDAERKRSRTAHENLTCWKPWNKPFNKEFQC